jgi:hypothetical protein
MRIDGPQITGSFNLNGDTVADLDVLVTTSSLNTYTSSVNTTMGHVMTATHSLNTFTSSATTRLNTIEGVTGSYATTGSNVFVGNQTISGSVIPSVTNAYDLGSSTHQFRHIYISSGSLYIDGTKVLGSTSQELQITTDAGQSFKILEAGSDTITLQSADGNITLATSGGGDVIMDPTTGIIALKGTTQIYAGNKVRSSDGNNIVFGDGLTVSGSITVTGFIETQELRTTYISSSILYRSGSTKFGDELGDTHAFTGSLLVSGSISVPGSGLVSGSSQVSYTGLSNVPSGIVSGSSQVLNASGVWSGSAQLPSGTVSGSVQVDVMSTTNIARLATTGSNTFIGTESVSGSLSTIGRVKITTKLASAASPDAAGDYYIALNNPTHNDTGSLLMADNGNVWLNSAGNKTLWLNWYGMSNAVSKSDVRIGDGYGGTEILAVYGSARRVDINGSANITGSLNTSGVVTVGSTLIANTGTGAIFRAIYNGDNIVEIGNYNVANGYRDVDIAASRLRFYTSTAGAANGTLALTLGTNQLATFSGDIVLSKGVDPKISSGTGIGLNIDGAALYLNRYSQSNIVMVPNGGQVGIGDSPSYTLHVKKNANQVAGFESPNANTWIDLISTSGNWSLGASNTDTSSFGVYQRVAGGTAVNKEYLNVNSSGNLGVNLQGSSAGFQITSPDYDGYEVTTWVGTTPSIIRYAGSNRFNIINSGSYSGLRTQSSRWRYMRIEADIKSSNADHYGFFWSSSQTTLGADSNAGFKWVFQPSSNTINIRDINGNSDQAVSAAVPFDEKDGNWHHYVTELSHDGRVRIWVDGVLYHNRYGYNPGFGYCGILNFTGTLEVSNFTITSSETVVQDIGFFAYHNASDVNYVNTILPYQNELYDYGGGYNTNGTYTAPVAGMYMFSATCNAYAGGSYPNTVPRAYWQINSADIGNSVHFRGNDLAGAATSGLTQRSATVVLYLNYGDTVRILVRDGQFDLFGANHFCGYLLK